jgi:hypothetical protein
MKARLNLRLFAACRVPQTSRTGTWGRRFRNLGWLWPWGNVHGIVTEGSTGWRHRSTLIANSALCTLLACGLGRFWHGLLNWRTRGLVHLWGSLLLGTQFTEETESMSQGIMYNSQMLLGNR